MNKLKIWSKDKILRVIINFFRDPICYACSCIDTIKLIAKEKRLGIKTSGVYFFKDNLSLYKDEQGYQGTSYFKLEKMTDYLKLSKEDVFIDLGCGEGRPIFFVATQRLKKVVGVELRKELVDIAKKNLNNLRLNNTSIEIIDTDAATFDAKEGTVFFMFNPFGQKTFAEVINNIKNSLITNPRKIRIVYLNPVYRNLLDTQDWLVSDGEINNTGIFVWHNRSD